MYKKSCLSSTPFHALFINCQYQSDIVVVEEDGLLALNGKLCNFDSVDDSFITIKIIIEESEHEECGVVYHTYFFTNKELLKFFKDVYYNHIFTFAEARKILQKVGK